MDTFPYWLLEVYLSFKTQDDAFLIIVELFSLAMFLFLTTVRISNYERPVPTKRAKIGSIEVKSCNASLHMLPVYIRNYLKSVPRYKFLISHICYPGCINMRKEVKFRGFFSKPKGACE